MHFLYWKCVHFAIQNHYVIANDSPQHQASWSLTKKEVRVLQWRNFQLRPLLPTDTLQLRLT